MHFYILIRSKIKKSKSYKLVYLDWSILWLVYLKKSNVMTWEKSFVDWFYFWPIRILYCLLTIKLRNCILKNIICIPWLSSNSLLYLSKYFCKEGKRATNRVRRRDKRREEKGKESEIREKRRAREGGKVEGARERSKPLRKYGTGLILSKENKDIYLSIYLSIFQFIYQSSYQFIY